MGDRFWHIDPGPNYVAGQDDDPPEECGGLDWETCDEQCPYVLQEARKRMAQQDTEAEEFPGMKYDKLPPHMREGMKLYVEYGVMTGSFANAVMENKLVEAYMYADQENTHAMRSWANWLYNDAPRYPVPCWGSPEVVAHWKEVGGLRGVMKQAQEELDDG